MKVPNISPSRLSTRAQCKRRETYSRCRPRGPQHPAAALGEAVHNVLEGWLEHGKIDTTTKQGQIAAPGLVHLPMPGVAQVETKFREQWADGVWYSGRIDFQYGDPVGTVLIGDHKTTGNWSRVKTAAELLDDPQRIIYSYWAVQKFPAVENVAAQWIYYHTKNPPKSESVIVIEPAALVRERFLQMHHAQALPLLADVHTPPEAMPRSIGPLCKWCDFRLECLENVSTTDLAIHSLLSKG